MCVSMPGLSAYIYFTFLFFSFFLFTCFQMILNDAIYLCMFVYVVCILCICVSDISYFWGQLMLMCLCVFLGPIGDPFWHKR